MQSVSAQRVAFGTSGHRGSALDVSFNEAHILAITQAICEYRRQQPSRAALPGADTHALSDSGLGQRDRGARGERRQRHDRSTARLHADARRLACHPDLQSRPHDRSSPTASSSRRRTTRRDDGGFKYNPPNGGPADTRVTRWIRTAPTRCSADELQG